MTTNVLLLIASFLLLALLPMLPGLIDLWQSDIRAFLDIPSDRDDDPRHFSRRLKKVVAEAQTHDARTLLIDDARQAETILKSSLSLQTTGPFSRLLSHTPLTTETRIAVIKAGVNLASPFTWLGDTVAKGAIVLHRNSTLRTLRCEGHCLMHPEVTLLRWLDAHSLYVMGPNRLPHRTTAKSTMSLAPGVHFQRLHAPVIEVQESGETLLTPPQHEGLPPLPPDVEIWRLDADDETISGHKVFAADVYLCADSAVQTDVVCNGDLHVGERALIKGNLKIRGDLFLHAGSRITGHVQCHGSITLDRGCEIDGVMSSLGHLSVSGNCILGTTGAPTSLIADTITLHAGARVHGQVWARHAGLTDV